MTNPETATGAADARTAGRPPALEGVPRVIAHRGASAEAPENTLPAFDLAAEMGAGGIECDVRLTADDVPVIHHDDTVDRTTDGGGRVDKHTLDELRDLDAGTGRGRRFHGTTVPTLDEVLDRYARRLWLDLELKPGRSDVATLVDAVAEALQAHDDPPGVLLSSFRPDALEVARDRLPDVPRALIVAEVPDAVPLGEVTEGLDGLGVNKAAVTDDLVDRVHDLDLVLFAWTVNDVGAARDLYEAGVDGVITDDPRRVLRVSPP